MPGRRSIRLVAVCLVILALAACGGGDDDGGETLDSSEAPITTTSESATTPTDSTSDPVDNSAGDGGSGNAPNTYTVRAGDTLSEIARQFDTTVQAIVRANDLRDPDIIDVGQELTIP